MGPVIILWSTPRKRGDRRLEFLWATLVFKFLFPRDFFWAEVMSQKLWIEIKLCAWCGERESRNCNPCFKHSFVLIPHFLRVLTMLMMVLSLNFILFLKYFIIILCAQISWLHACMSVYYMYGHSQRGQKSLDIPGTGVKRAGSQHVDVGNQHSALNCWAISQCLELHSWV